MEEKKGKDQSSSPGQVHRWILRQDRSSVNRTAPMRRARTAGRDTCSPTRHRETASAIGSSQPWTVRERWGRRVTRGRRARDSRPGSKSRSRSEIHAEADDDHARLHGGELRDFSGREGLDRNRVVFVEEIADVQLQPVVEAAEGLQLAAIAV